LKVVPKAEKTACIAVVDGLKTVEDIQHQKENLYRDIATEEGTIIFVIVKSDYRRIIALEMKFEINAF